MDTKRNADIQKCDATKLTSIDKESIALEAKCWADHLSRFPELCRKQTSDIELEEARKRGCYRLLPPVVAPHENERTMSEMLLDIDEEVRKTLIF